MSQTTALKCGAFVRHRRQALGLDQAELARRVGTAQPAISRIERDAVSPSVGMLNRLLEALGETLSLQALPLDAPAPGGGNQTVAELRADYRGLSPEERLAQAAHLSEIATGLAAQAEM
jgi:transcriptional regulator with XRE-family HTH domain